MAFATIDELETALRGAAYLPERGLSTALFLSLALEKPLLLDALKRRCLFHWIGHPALEREIEIVTLRVPGIPERLATQAAAFVQSLRRLDLAKPPGVAETIDWAHALAALGRQELDAELVEQTLGSVLKYHEDLLAVRDETLAGLIEEARAAR